MANRARPWTDAEDQTLIDGNIAGESLTSIARKVGRPNSSVHNRAKTLKRPDGSPLTWDTSKTAEASKARHDRLKERRMGLLERAMDAAEGVYDTIEAPTYKRIFKGNYGQELVKEIDFIPPAERRDLAATATQHVAVMIRLAAVDDDQGADVGKSMLTRLALDIGGELAADIRTKIELNAGRIDA
jgi:hypothetical protein